MSMHFLIGKSGSGKSTYLYSKILEDSIANKDQQYVFLVPEQFTMHIQRRLVEMHPRHSVMNIEVLSFERLAYRVFDELMVDSLHVLEDTGKSFVLRKLAGDYEEELESLGANLKKSGYINELKSLFSEFMQYCIGLEDLEEMMELPDMSPSFQRRLKDVYVMYQAFLTYIDGKYITSEEILDLLNQVISESGFVENSVLIFDGFTGFTPIQHQLLSNMLPMAKEAYFAVTMDPSVDAFSKVKEHELFAMSKKMIQRLMKIADETNVSVEEPLYFPLENPTRHRKGGRLEHLEKNILRDTYQKFPSQDTADYISICHVNRPEDELRFVASDIRRRVRTDSCRYFEFAVVAANLEAYEDLAEHIFAEYEVPIYLDVKTDLSLHPAIEFLRGALLMVRLDFSYEGVFHFLKTGFTSLEREDVDCLENYILATGIRGVRAYQKEFTMKPNRMSDEELARLNQIRLCFMEEVEPVLPLIGQDMLSVREITTAFYHLMTRFSLEDQLYQRSKYFEQRGQMREAKKYCQIYGILIDLMDKMVALLADEEISILEYSDILEAGFSSANVGTIPSDRDLVIIGDIERTRLEDIKYLYFIGLNDGAVPKAIPAGGIFTETDRMLLSEASCELAPTAREKAFMQRFYLYQILTKPSLGLTLTYSRVNDDGDAVRASYLIPMVLRLFEDLEVEEYQSLPAFVFTETEKALKTYVATRAREYMKTGELSSDDTRLLSTYFNRNEEEAGILLEAASKYHREDRIGQAARKAVFGEGITGSVTKLEQYASCAYAYFLKYGLSLKERKEHSLTNLDMGNLYHEALERYAMNLTKANLSWFDITSDEEEAILDEAIRVTMEEDFARDFSSSMRESYVLNRMKKTLHTTVDVITEQIRHGGFLPTAFEVKFSDLSKEGMKYILSNGEILELQGKIDRLDLYEKDSRLYVKIVDYKSSDKKVDFTRLVDGSQIQLFVYMDAAMNGMAKLHLDKDVKMGALFYYFLDQPLLDGTKKVSFLSEDERNREKLLSLRSEGLINSSIEVQGALDLELEDGEKSLYAKVEKNKDGDYKLENSVSLTEEEYSIISSFIEKKIHQMGDNILEGEITARPKQYDKDRNACSYCPYQGACGFDLSLPGYSFDEASKLSKDEAIMIMRDELIDQDEEGGDKDE